MQPMKTQNNPKTHTGLHQPLALVLVLWACSVVALCGLLTGTVHAARI